MPLYRVQISRHSTADIFLVVDGDEQDAATLAEDMMTDVDESEFDHEHYAVQAVVDVEADADSTLSACIANTGQSVVEYLNERLSAAEDD